MVVMSESLFARFPWFTRTRASAAIFGIALLGVALWPRAHRTIEFVTVTAIAGALGAVASGLTFWAKARVQIGRRKLRYKRVRELSAAIAVVGLSFLMVQRVSIRIWPQKSSTEFIVAVARFDNDDRGEVTNALINALNGLDRRLKIRAVGLDRTIPIKRAQVAEITAARELQAKVVLWGSASGASEHRIVALYAGEDRTIPGQGGGPHIEDSKVLDFPLQDLAPYVTLTVAAERLQVPRSGGGTIAAELLNPMIEAARTMANDPARRAGWSVNTRGQVNLAIGSALQITGAG